MSQRFGNGTGRDSYVQSNDGGFSSAHIPGEVTDRVKFVQSLREKHQNRPNQDLRFEKPTTNQIVKREKLKKTSSARKGLDCSMRLYVDDVKKRETQYSQHEDTAYLFDTNKCLKDLNKLKTPVRPKTRGYFG